MAPIPSPSLSSPSFKRSFSAAPNGSHHSSPTLATNDVQSKSNHRKRPRLSSIASSSSSPHARKASMGDGEQRGHSTIDPGIIEAKRRLPITAGRQAIVNAVRQNDTVVILGETGSGKTTQIPQYLYEAGLTKPSRPGAKHRLIGVTQPRRVAAISLAKRVAAELGCPEPDGDTFRTLSRKGRARADDGSNASGEVGFAIRFNDCTTPNTRIKFMTDGWLLREMQLGAGEHRDPRSAPLSPTTGHTLLDEYSVLIIDEAHERSVQTDLLLGMAKRIQRLRKEKRKAWLQERNHAKQTDAEGHVGKQSGEPPTELKIVIMSATLDAEAFAAFFAGARGRVLDPPPSVVPILYIKGRQHPVELYHTPEAHEDWVSSAKRLVLWIHLQQAPGDILVFATGAEEIESLRMGIESLASGLPSLHERRGVRVQSLLVAPIYAALGPSAVAKVFAPTPQGARKVVLATNIAETSITIPGIRYVVDCGLAKQRVHRHSTAGGSIDTLTAQPISKSAARQRTGRAGRDAPGVCYRLYTEETFDRLDDATQPEVLRTELSSALLDLYSMNVDPFTFDWMDRPDQEQMAATVVALTELGALDIVPAVADARTNGGSKGTEGEDAAPPTPATTASSFKLTGLGKRMASLPLPPQLSRVLLAAAERGPVVARQARDLVAILSSDRGSILMDPSPQPNFSAATRRGADGAEELDPRDEAARVRAAMAHPSGDHATQLSTLYSYMRMAETAVSGKGSGSHARVGVGGEELAKQNGRLAKARRDEVKAWCSAHFVSSRSVQQVLKIRQQLRHLCRRNRIVCDDDNDEEASQRGGGARMRWRDSRHNLNRNLEDVDKEASKEDEDLSPRLLVTKGGGDGDGRSTETLEDYAELRRCLLEGRLANVGVRTPEGTYQRLFGGERFKIHPSSCLFGKRAAVVLFEELSFTSQVYARTVSTLEASWLEEQRASAWKRKESGA